MKIIVSERVAGGYGKRIRTIVPRGRLITPVLGADRDVTWSSDVSDADVCCLSEERRHAL